MEVSTLLVRLSVAGIALSRRGDELIVWPRALLTDELRSAIRESKPQLIAAVSCHETNDIVDDEAQEARRRQVLTLLNERPDAKRAFVASPTSNGGGLITLAVPNIGSGELNLPSGTYDGMAIKRLFDDLETNADVQAS
jgi:TubC N-terminal docking domain